MGVVNTKVLPAGRSVAMSGPHRAVHTWWAGGVRTTTRVPTLRTPSPAEYHNAKVSSAQRVPIGMLWNVEGNGQQDTLHMAGDNVFASTLPCYTFDDGIGPQALREGGGMSDTMHPPDLKWLDAFYQEYSDNAGWN
ncbi:uncharacterized protein LOC144904320 [Branchiostoma floridae x Branchiostoma belcheri]